MWSRAEDGAVYRLLQQNVKKQNKTKQNRKDSGTKTASTVFVSLLTQARFTLKRPGDIRTARACQFFALVLILWSLHVKTQVSYTLCFAVAFCAQGGGAGVGGGQSQPMRASVKKREQEEEIQVLPENVSLQRKRL